MASSCTTIPTLTRTTTVTTQSTSTIVSSSVTTSPPSTTFITSTSISCPSVTSGSTSCQTTTQVTDSLISGTTSIVGITQTTVVPITSFVVTTLYSTSCVVLTTSNTNPAITSTSSTSTSTPPSLTTMTSMSSSTAANGSVVVTRVTETSTYLPSTSSTSTASGVYHPNTTSLNLAPIIGGSVGGFFGLSAIVLIGWYLWKRKQKWDNLLAEDPILNDAFPKPKRDPAMDTRPRPYQYGIVGHSAVPPHMSPPPSTGLSLSLDVPSTRPLHNPPLSQKQSAMQQAQQSAAQQQQQQQSVTQQSQNSVGQQQSVGQQAVMQQQQVVGPSSGQQPPNQQTHGMLPSSSLYNHAITAASAASLSPRPSANSAMSGVQDSLSSLSTVSAPGPWVGPGGSRYPPGMQRNLSATAGLHAASRPGAALGTGQRQSVIDENEVYGGIGMDAAVAGSSGAHGYGRLPGVGAGTGLGQDISEFNPYHEPQQPPARREQRDGKGRLVKVTEKPPVVHLDGGRYRAPVLSPGPASHLGSEPVTAPPAYSA